MSSSDYSRSESEDGAGDDAWDAIHPPTSSDPSTPSCLSSETPGSVIAATSGHPEAPTADVVHAHSYPSLLNRFQQVAVSRGLRQLNTGTSPSRRPVPRQRGYASYQARRRSDAAGDPTLEITCDYYVADVTSTGDSCAQVSALETFRSRQTLTATELQADIEEILSHVRTVLRSRRRLQYSGHSPQTQWRQLEEANAAISAQELGQHISLASSLQTQLQIIRTQEAQSSWQQIHAAQAMLDRQRRSEDRLAVRLASFNYNAPGSLPCLWVPDDPYPDGPAPPNWMHRQSSSAGDGPFADLFRSAVVPSAVPNPTVVHGTVTSYNGAAESMRGMLHSRPVASAANGTYASRM